MSNQNTDAQHIENPWSEFPPHSHEEWSRQVEEGPKGTPLAKLSSPTLEGMAVKPLYRREDAAKLVHLGGLPGQSPFARGSTPAGERARPWHVVSEIAAAEPASWNAEARKEIAGGATALAVRIDAAAEAGVDPDDEQAVNRVGQGGASVSTANDLRVMLEGIDLTKTALFVGGRGSAMGMSALLLAALGGESVQLGGLEGGLAADPLGALAGAGALDLPLKTAHDELADLARWWGERAPRWRAITVDAEIYHDAGASAVLELGLAVATGAEYLRELLERGLSPEQAAATISFRFALGTRFFTEVAKLRAARLLWDAVTTAFGCSEERRAMHVQARSSSFVQSRLDPWVNMIRSTVATCAAAVGGADALGVSPFDQPLTLPDAFSRRQARNVQVLARDEAYLGRVADPAGGSWYVESLTDELARAAWNLFQQIEERGGMGTALREGFPQAELARTWSAREAAIARRQERLIGASVYPNLKEVVPHRDQISGEELRRRLAEALGARRQTVAAEPRDRAIAELRDAPGGTGARLEAARKAAASGATLGELTRALHPGGSVLVVPAVARGRAAKPFETLRSAADAHASHSGARPRALLAAVGALGPLRARVDFAAGALEVGGFEVLRTEELSSGGAAADAAARAGCPVLMLCASDSDYPTVVPAVVEQLRAAPRGQGPSRIVLAGRPPKEPGATWASGVDEFVFLGCDIVAALMRLQRGAGLEVLP